MCNLGVVLIILDKDMNKVIEYNSGSATDGLFTWADAFQVLELAKEGKKVYNYVTDDDYMTFLRGKGSNMEDLSERHMLVGQQP